ncbi:hypothetical protein EMIHUDRAFT_227293 [Emiliania huxleyi CCMP1516]|uniref:TNFR-Cys domain-containing protein n=2 Tax=Emiliania huxleyi TaxID=2903 RepID=A0A0D3KJ20_EMIH1|nr:hypothetical protein EMIHUDRAFT_227293 [Emiliania huxleyi CCMP1516]EOD35755.1 hypothetical protein EMIHUDRAFT_227293 [Emiliania huxleyi CCMP1516]|eukprot:XP_005788184.1 hypothetical protein EMIHUDRAFT_227293 [Emiliania huxleyi CCMP1516]
MLLGLIESEAALNSSLVEKKDTKGLSQDKMIFATALVALGLAKRELEAKLYGPSGDVVKTFEDDAVIDQVPASADEKLEVTSSTHSLATGLVNEGTIDVKNTAVLKASSSTENSCAESPCPDGFFCDASDVCTPCLSCVGGPVAADVLHRLNGLAAGTYKEGQIFMQPNPIKFLALAAGTYKEGQVFTQATTDAVGTVTGIPERGSTYTIVRMSVTAGAFDTSNVITVTKGDAADLAGLPADSDASTDGHQVAAPTDTYEPPARSGTVAKTPAVTLTIAAGKYKEGQVFSQATTNAVGTVTATTSETATSVTIKTTTGAFDTFNVITVTKGDAADLAGLPADSDASTGGHQVAAPTSVVGATSVVVAWTNYGPKGFDTSNDITVTKGYAADLAGLPADSDASTGGHQLAAPGAVADEPLPWADICGGEPLPWTPDGNTCVEATATTNCEEKCAASSTIALLWASTGAGLLNEGTINVLDNAVLESAAVNGGGKGGGDDGLANSGALNVLDNAELKVGSGTSFVNGATDSLFYFTGYDDPSADGGTVTIAGSASIKNSGSIAILRSKLENAGTVDNEGYIHLYYDSVLENAGTVNNEGEIDLRDNSVLENAGTVNNEGEIELSYDAVLANTATGTIENSEEGEIDLRHDSVLENAGTVNNEGEIDLYYDSVLENAGTVNNEGRVELSYDAVLANTATGTIENSEEGEIDLRHDSVLENAGTVNNEGEIDLYYDSVLENAGTVNNEGRVELAYDAVLANTATGTIETSEEGEIDLRHDSVLENAGTVNNEGEIDLYYDSVLENAGTVNNEGRVELAYGAVLANTATGIIENSEEGEIALENAELENAGKISTAGEISLRGEDAMLNNTGTIESLGGTIELTDGAPSLEIACTPCGDGFFKPGIGADACTPKKTDCPVGEYLTASTDKTSDATCTEMKTDCPAGEYFTASTDKTSDATCTACAAAEFKEGVNAITSCTPKTTDCTASEYLVESPDSTTDSNCTPLPPDTSVAVSFTLSIAAPTTRRLRSLDTIDLDEIMTAVIDSFATLASPVTVTSEQIALEDLGDDKVRVTIVPAAGQTAAEIKTAATATNNDQIEFLVTLGAKLGSGRTSKKATRRAAKA